jgi:hypothetical protein
MAFEILIRLGGWGPDTPPEDMARVIEHLVEGVALANYGQMRAQPFPTIGSGVIHYDVEGDAELFDDATTVLSRRSGDCDDLVAYRLAECWIEGDLEAEALVNWQRTEPSEDDASGIPWLFHVRVRRGNGQIEDPSEDLGMGRLVGANG